MRIKNTLLAALVACPVLVSPLMAENEAAIKAAESRIRDHVGFLASDELEGRGVGTTGLNKASQFMAGQLTALGLDMTAVGGKPFQTFEVVTEAKLGPDDKNTLKLVGPEAKEAAPLELGKQFNPLAAGGSGKFDLPIVFVGYGITAPDLMYDDYADIDVKGKAVLMLRKEPQGDPHNPHSPFGGPHPSRHATFSRKISNAYQQGAAAVIMVNNLDEIETRVEDQQNVWNTAVADMAKVQAEYDALADDAPEEKKIELRDKLTDLAKTISESGAKLKEGTDEVLPFMGAGSDESHPNLPVYFALRSAIDPVVKKALNNSLADLEAKINEAKKPHSAVLADWKAVGETDVIREKAEISNVIGVLHGEGPLADEIILIGAHYDHIGYGGEGSLAPWTHEIHNGADDNASGAVALLETARKIVGRDGKPKRTIVFIGFTGEERGLLGSAYYVKHPVFDLEKTVAMLNMDMVGRLTDDKLIISGSGTAKEFESLIDKLNEEYKFAVTKDPGGFGPSDHASFYAKEIPVMHFFTGTHDDYHRPSDDVEKLDIAGIRRIASMLADAAIAVDAMPAPPEYVAIAPESTERRTGSRPYFGSIPDFSVVGQGYALQGVSPDSPAAKAGMKAGDIIVKLGDNKIAGLEDFDGALRGYKAGDKAKVTIMRSGMEITLTVTLAAPR
ncbi:M20/M25/M40 family metallo-hydrolase [Blastopirellula sp. JC732]|uniref:M20/M25/M40 family metallo-hydrolase n=1 Tax=Blastopirellula sediminis TaxID=2894196 RepID=A0A9X1SES2_9BACT|nr:M20/M25/M40 family metallo-hydrolase [Blastopirellula sediminis]MCC9609013.1 M20/M25/M40 family metallo-hydrolase [Blastopirellula sediminis]MCC9628210.1 M20/M25/M40 family metallo-hydrolase [Blastopirellula sediminis]